MPRSYPILTHDLGGGGKPPEPEPEQQPVGWWPSWLPPYIPGGGTPAEPEPEPEPEESQPSYVPGGGTPGSPAPAPEPEESTQTYTSPHEFADRPITSEQYERYREEIREGKQDRDKQQSAPQNTEPLGASVLQDIEWSRDIEASEPLGLMFGGKGTTDIAEDMVDGVCEGLYRVNPEGTAAFVRFTTGLEPDEEDCRTAEEMAKLFRSAGFVEHFDSELRGSLRQGPRSSFRGPPFAGDYFDMAYAPRQGIPWSGMRFAYATDEESTEAEEPTPVETADHYAEYRPDPSNLNERTVDHLKELFPDADLKTREELKVFLQGRLAHLAPEFDDPEIGWDEFSTDDMIIFYISALKLAMELYTLPKDPAYMSKERLAIATELGIVDDLLEKAALTPLEDLDAMLDAYGWEDKAEAIAYFRHRVEVVYGKLNRELPPGWAALDDPVVMANMLHAGIGEMESILGRGDHFLDFDDPSASDWGMIHNAALFLDSEPKMLTGTRNLGPDLTLLLFIGSMFFEPLDWVMTAADVAQALEEGDVGGAVLNAFLGLMPFVSSKTDDFIRYGAEIAGGAGRAGVDSVLRGIDEGSDAARALAKVGKTAEDFAVKFNKFNLASADDFHKKILNHPKFQHLSGAELESALWKEARKRANRSNSRKLRRQLRWAVKEDRYAWDWRVPAKGQDTHHLLPSGDILAKDARIHMENLGISVNSAYNGVGLHRKVHVLTYPDRYVDAVSKAIQEFDNPDDLVQFLNDVARDLSELNQFVGNEVLLKSKFDDFLTGIEEISQ